MGLAQKAALAYSPQRRDAEDLQQPPLRVAVLSVDTSSEEGSELALELNVGDKLPVLQLYAKYVSSPLHHHLNPCLLLCISTFYAIAPCAA